MTTIALRGGTLRLQVERADVPLDELCGFATRRSRKRGFVFVSKILGKHYPVRPQRMAEMHDRLAERLTDVPGPALLIALAETATGLGHGVYEAWLRRTRRDDVLFQHTTRYRLNRPLALTFDESHSHATEHLLYEPADPANAALFRRARSLVLVDDELSTGRTLANLAAAYRKFNDGLTGVHLVCLTDWLGANRRTEIAAQIGVPMSIHSLLQGTFTFEEDPAFDPGPIPNVTGRGDLKDWCLPVDYGRLGLRGLLCNVEETGNVEDTASRLATSPPLSPRYSGGRGVGVRGDDIPSEMDVIPRAMHVPLTPNPSPPEYQGRGEMHESRFREPQTDPRQDLHRLIQASGVRPGERVLVLGTGEFAYPPFLLARGLEELGWEVHFQTTTRSPLLVDRDIGSVLEFVDNYHDGIPNYVYNVIGGEYDKILIGYETQPLPVEHTLPALIGATPLTFGNSG